MNEKVTDREREREAREARERWAWLWWKKDDATYRSECADVSSRSF